MPATALENTPIRIGISACLLGQPVRFDGGHKKDDFLTDILGQHVEYVPVCPEVEMGLGTPRETLRLVRQGDGLRMITTRTNVDHTDAMNRWARERLGALEREDLSGYILKKDSPSCGMERVKTYTGHDSTEFITGAARPVGRPAARDGRGLFASALLERLPLLPVEEEGRLSDPTLRENFIERVFAYRRLTDLFSSRWTIGSLVKFHTAHKMSLLAHSTTAYNGLGRLVGRGRDLPRAELRRAYETLFMRTLAIPATRARYTNVLQHIAGHLKTVVDDDDRGELAACIDEYRRGLVPLVVPLTLIRHHVRRGRVAYLAGQVFLEPHPRELMLRNHV